MGQKDMKNALEIAYKLSQKTHLPKVVIVITDGVVKETDKMGILNEVFKNVKHTKTFTVAIDDYNPFVPQKKDHFLN